jgi:hypothetical protein
LVDLRFSYESCSCFVDALIKSSELAYFGVVRSMKMRSSIVMVSSCLDDSSCRLFRLPKAASSGALDAAFFLVGSLPNTWLQCFTSSSRILATSECCIRDAYRRRLQLVVDLLLFQLTVSQDFLKLLVSVFNDDFVVRHFGFLDCLRFSESHMFDLLHLVAEFEASLFADLCKSRVPCERSSSRG